MAKMFFRSKRDKSEKTSRRRCYVIEKYQPYLHFRFVDQVTRLATRFLHPKYSQSSKYNLLFFPCPKLLCSIAMCSKASCFAQLGKDQIWFVSKMAFNTSVVSGTSVKHRIEVQDRSQNRYLFKQSQPLEFFIKIQGKSSRYIRIASLIIFRLVTREILALPVFMHICLPACPFSSNNFLSIFCLPKKFLRAVKFLERVNS